MESEQANSISHQAVQYLQTAVMEDPPRGNAFRVLGLDVYADSRQIWHREQMLAIGRIKLADASAACLPLLAPATPEQITQAIRRLRFPACRLIDELFWFWPDQALPSLASHTEQVLGRWTEQESGSGSWQARHCLAVFYLAKALDYEALDIEGVSLTDKQSAACSACWVRSIPRWRQLRQQDDLWQHYRSRVEHFRDPRCRPETIPDVRQAMDESLLRVLIALCIRASRDNRRASLGRLAQLIDRADFEPAWRVSVARAQLIPLADELRLMLEYAQQSARRDPPSGSKRIHEFLDKAEPILGLFVLLLGDADILTTSIGNELAMGLLNAQIAGTNIADDWLDATRNLQAIRAMAMTESSRQRLEHNIGIIEGNLRRSLL